MNLKKIILLSLLAIILIAAGYVAYIMLTTRSHSPAEKMEYSDGNFNLSVDYCRPYKKGRLIFGEKSDGALLPYGVYWRTGANESTEIEFNQNIIVNGNKLDAGRYRFYTVPDKNTWIVAFNSELEEWGYGEPDYEMDILRTEIPVNQLSQSTEQFTISGAQNGENKMYIILTWDTTEIKIPIDY
jgi:hypothetical protein